jgi:hypothetical protein
MSLALSISRVMAEDQVDFVCEPILAALER